MSEKKIRSQRGNPLIKVWDTQYSSPRESFSIFREAVCTTFMPWSPEFKSDELFNGRVEGITFETGSVGRTRMTPLSAVRNKLELANSPIEGFYANFVLSGELKIEQAGRTNVARRGELVIYDTALPVTLTERSSASYEDIAFLVPKNRLEMLKNREEKFVNHRVTQEIQLEPLFNCVKLFASRMLTATGDELNALFDACVSLLPLVGECFDDGTRSELVAPSKKDIWQEILDFIHRNISNRELSADHVAKQFGVSSRYVYKLFAVNGTTFSAYVSAKRLDHVCRDLLSSSRQNVPIFVIARRWGFNHISTFNRAFKNRFACTPDQFRKQFGW